MLMSARRQAIMDVIKTEYRGTAEFSVTCSFMIRSEILIRGLWWNSNLPGSIIASREFHGL